MRGLLPHSIQGRMLLLSAAATMIVVVVAGWMIAAVLGRFVTEGLDRRLDAELTLLASAVDRGGQVDEALLRGRLASFEEGPGWRWRIRTPDRTIASTDFPVIEPPPPPDAIDHPEHDHRRPREIPDGRGEPLHARTLSLETTRGTIELTAAAPRALLRRPIEAALAPLLATLALLAALLTASSVLQLRIGLRPLRRLRGELAAIRTGKAERVGEDQPTELRPLATELNALAAQNEATLATARLSAANLAHALKTPVATLGLELQANPAHAAQINRIEATIRHHLTRARMGTGHGRVSTLLSPAVMDVVDAVRHLNSDRVRMVKVAVPAHLAVAVDPQDLDELLGNLVDNGFRHARSKLIISAEAHPTNARLARLSVSDDGPGLSMQAREAIGNPGLRLDEREPGYGFGLAIVRDLTALYGGTATFGEARGGGLTVEIVLPVAA